MNKINFNKKLLIVIGCLILVIGLSYAFYTAMIDPNAISKIFSTSSKVDRLTFEKGNYLVINSNQFNFAEGAGNLSSETVSKAKLIANDNEELASENYQVYLEIKGNSFIYTANSSKPELIVTITDPSGNIINDEKYGLNYVTLKDAVDGLTQEWKVKCNTKLK